MLNVLPGRNDTSRALRIESVDNYHSQWSAVLSHAAATGQASQLCLDADGWLSARQVVLAAWLDEEIVGFAAFSVCPRIDAEGVALEAHLDALAVTPRFESEWIETSLLQSAQERAAAVKCRRMLREAA